MVSYSLCLVIIIQNIWYRIRNACQQRLQLSTVTSDNLSQLFMSKQYFTIISVTLLKYFLPLQAANLHSGILRNLLLCDTVVICRCHFKQLNALGYQCLWMGKVSYFMSLYVYLSWFNCSCSWCCVLQYNFNPNTISLCMSILSSETTCSFFQAAQWI